MVQDERCSAHWCTTRAPVTLHTPWLNLSWLVPTLQLPSTAEPRPSAHAERPPYLALTHAAHARSSRTQPTHAAHTRSPRTQLTHAAHAHSSHTQPAHAAHARSPRTQPTHAAHTRSSRTQLTHAAHARSSRTQLTRAAHARSSCTQLTHAAHARTQLMHARSSRSACPTPHKEHVKCSLDTPGAAGPPGSGASWG